MARGRKRADPLETPEREESPEPTRSHNVKARAGTIRAAVDWIAEKEAEVKALNAEIREYKQKHIKGDLGFKLADWNAVYRVSQLETDDRDQLLDTIREGFAALSIGGQSDWLDAAEKVDPEPAPQYA